MEILEDNFTNKKNIEDKQYELTCEGCNSKLAYEKPDVINLAYGLPYLQCPLCGQFNEINEINDEGLKLELTKDNVIYPMHFNHTSKHYGAKEISDEDVNEYIKEVVEVVIENNIDNLSGHITGDLFLNIRKDDEFDEYEITVARDFYSTLIKI